MVIRLSDAIYDTLLFIMLEPEIKRKLLADVAHFYEFAGADFASTRHAPRDVMRLISDRVNSGDVIIDVGAGNGRLADVLPIDVSYVGIEPSLALRSAAKVGIKMLEGSLPNLDVPSASADIVACLAVLHHIPSDEMRHTAVLELERILKPGGLLVCTVWNLRSCHFLTRLTALSAWLRIPGFKGGGFGDLQYPWRAAGHNDSRYVHAFTFREFKKLFDKSTWIVEKIGAYDHFTWKHWSKGRNLVALVRRK